MEQYEEKVDQMEIKSSQLESKLQKSELICAKKEKENEKMQITIDELKIQVTEKDELLEKIPKQSEEKIRNQIDITNSKIQENFNLKNVIDQ